VEGAGRSVLATLNWHLPRQTFRIRFRGSGAGTSSESSLHCHAIFLSKIHPNIIVQSTLVSEVICTCLCLFLICVLHTSSTQSE